MRSFSVCPVLFRTHASIVVSELEKLNTIPGLLPTVCRETQVFSRALAALGLLQLGSHVCVRVSKDLWYLTSLPPFYLIVHMRVQTLKRKLPFLGKKMS